MSGKRKRRPSFTDEELRTIHKELEHMAWQEDEGYVARKAIIAKLDLYFGKGPG
jgi:hypothetical protein